jgi:hypothetical protein
MLFLDGVYVDGANGTRFQWVKAPTSAELTQLAHRIAHRVGRFLERQGLLEQDAENSYLASDAVDVLWFGKKYEIFAADFALVR